MMNIRGYRENKSLGLITVEKVIDPHPSITEDVFAVVSRRFDIKTGNEVNSNKERVIIKYLDELKVTLQEEILDIEALMTDLNAIL